MKKPFLILVSLMLGLLMVNCKRAGERTDIPAVSVPSPTPVKLVEADAVPITLPVLDALFSDQVFKSELKSKLQLTDEQIAGLQKIAADEVAKLRNLNGEEQAGDAAEIRKQATEAIRGLIGDKTDAFLALAREHWIRGNEEVEAVKEKEPELKMLVGPNAVPTDTRVVVNIPAFRMDVFQDGSLIKSYKIGIGYPEFPLPTGLRKAETIIFNPTWTPPDSPWVASMKNVSAGQKIEAGSSLNTLGPIKIPIGMPSLIHGGKSPAKIGTFASHGCVGLTNSQVKDFARTLAQAASKELSDKTIAAYLKDPAKTRVVKLDRQVPVELRYETIVVEDGKLHIYRDVYDQHTNILENVQAVLATVGLKLENLSDEERKLTLEALNALSAHPKKPAPSKSDNSNAAASSTKESPNVKENKSQRVQKSPRGNEKEIVIEISELKGKGYPSPVDLDTGNGKPKTLVAGKRP